jgi:hypothetical protein
VRIGVVGVNVALRIFNDDNRIVHNQSRGECDSEKRKGIN